MRDVSPRATSGRLPTPALAPALAVVAGAVLGTAGWGASVPLGGLLAAGGIALGRRPGWAVAALALGLLAGMVRPVPGVDGVDTGRPVELAARVSGHAVWDGESWSLPVRARLLRQGRQVRLARGLEVRLTLPGAEAPPAYGTELRVRGYLRRSAGYFNALPVEPGPWRMWVKSRRLLAVEAPPGTVARWAGGARAAVEEAMARAAGAARPAAPPTGLALVRALVLGDSTAVPPDWKRGLRRSGLIHVLAVSGLHVGLVAAAALLLAAPLPLRWRLPPALLAVGLYLLLAGPRPALLRATCMALLAAAAVVTRRPPAAANALAVTVTLLVLHRPSLVTDLGFRLTAGATAGLLFLAPRWVDRGQAVVDRWALAATRWFPASGRRVSRVAGGARFLVSAVAVALAAQLAAAPFAWPAFHLASLTSPLTNLVAVPWTALFLAVAMSWVALAIVSPNVAAGLVPLLDILASPFGWPAVGGPGAWGTVPVVAPVSACVLLGGLLVASAVHRGSPDPQPARRTVVPAGSSANPSRARWVPARWVPARWVEGWGSNLSRRLIPPTLFLLVLCLLPILRWGRLAGPPTPAGVSVTVLDVGQGDAILLRDAGHSVLVDGGGWRRGDFGQRVLLPALLGEGVHRLDAVVLTHPDRDHCGGLVDVASYLSVAEVWSAPGWEDDPCLGELVQAAVAGEPRRWRRLAAGDGRAVGEWRIRVLAPELPASPDGPDPAATEGRNDRSLVLSAYARGRRVLLTGDVETRAEASVLQRWERSAAEGTASLLRADLLKVAHHGSRSSTGTPFLRAVRPRWALVSAGRHNPYGHPAPDVVARLERAGARVAGTHDHGFLRVEWQGADGWRWTFGR